MAKEASKVLSLYDGAGCMYMALKLLDIEPDTYVSSEVDEPALRVTRARIPGNIQAGDVSNLTYRRGALYRGKWDGAKVVGPYTWLADGPFDFLVGGSPCQGFSLSGHQRGFDDPRSKLFWHFHRLLREVKPTYWLLENTRMKRKYLEAINTALGVGPMLIDSSLFGAQKRVRYYWCNFPVTTPEHKSPMSLEDILEPNVSSDYYYTSVAELVDNGSITLAPSFQHLTGVRSCAIRGRYVDGKTKQHLELQKSNKSNCITTVQKDSLVYVGGLEHMRRLHDGKSYSLNFREGGRVYHIEGKSATLTASPKGGVGGHTGLYTNESWVRKLTPVECERLQGWPDGWASNLVSATQAYKMCGNGWHAPTIAHIIKHALK
jgi:DNA (cytosine-5)-methyltransferase 3A